MQRIIYICFLIIPFTIFAQNEMVPYNHVLTDKELVELLDVNNYPELKETQTKFNKGEKEAALQQLAQYFKEKFSERYFFDWKNFDARFKEYNFMYSGRENFHYKEALKHLELYPAATLWKIPFKNQKGETVTAYPYRHLTRQHKAGDIALLYYYKKDKTYLDYIPEQAKSLNLAFNKNMVETIEDGNGAYEVYRAGNRIFNWLFVHQVLLASNEYFWQQQLEMIRTFLHTGAQLAQYNQKYAEGNHQTRGMSALAMLSFLFPEIKGTGQWKSLSLTRLEEHLEKEIYTDGFQFERSVHYHIDDIENYFYPLQMAQINNIELNPIWETRIKGLFDVLTKIAMPDKNAPVLQDDTDSPWAEFNKINNTMALGAVLFGELSYNYFASSKVAPSYYWFLKQDQLERLKTVKKKEPEIGSCSLPETGYYIMRQGWNDEDLYMIVSAGLTAEKPAHQHGDMLGVEAFAYGNMVLPNYQVRYYLEDFPEFKNSWVKNVTLVDSIPQGRDWSGNKGRSGFGQFDILPQPKVVAWKTTKEFDLFVGTHDGNNHIGTETYRAVIFIKDGFWIVSDKLFANKAEHTTQQVWQGHYDVEKEGKHIRSVFPNGAGLEVIQLGDSADKIFKASARGKGRTSFEKVFQNETTWTTLLFPFKDFEERIIVDDFQDFKVKGWQFKSNEHCPKNMLTDAQQIIYKDNKYFLMGVSKIEIIGNEISISNEKSDLWLQVEPDAIEVTNCGIKKVTINEKDIEPGKSTTIKF